MKTDIIVATMNCNPEDLIKKMGIQSSAIIANQCNINAVKEINYNGNKIHVLNFAERGVGLNRNNAIMRSCADICIMADDDMTFIEGYNEIVCDIFKNNPDVDVAIFNLGGNVKNNILKKKKVNLFNYMKYGAARIAFRREKLSYCGIYFNQNFGGGTRHNCGEDTIFLHDCLKNKLNIVHFPIKIADLDDSSESTWFKGYNEKYFYDRGILHSVLYNRKNSLYICLINLLFLIKNYKNITSNLGLFKCYKLMRKAVLDFKRGCINYEL